MLEQAQVFFENIFDAISWLIGPGAMMIASFVVSWVAERWAAFQKLSSAMKQGIIAILAGLIGLGGTWVMGNIELLEPYAPYIIIVMSMLATWLGTQIAHKLNPHREDKAG